jgi:hypothetical protein
VEGDAACGRGEAKCWWFARDVVADSPGEPGDLDRVVAERMPEPHQVRVSSRPRSQARPQLCCASRRRCDLGSGAPLDKLDEIVGGFGRLASLAGFASAEDRDEVHTELDEPLRPTRLANATMISVTSLYNMSLEPQRVLSEALSNRSGFGEPFNRGTYERSLGSLSGSCVHGSLHAGPEARLR